MTHEHAFVEQGLLTVCGLDEAGRGAWAGPVSAGAVILPYDQPDIFEVLEGVRDSKKCTPLQRERLFPVIFEAAIAAAPGLASAEEIDEFGIIGATQLAMRRAVESLGVSPAALLIDGRYLRLPTVNLPQKSMSRGEQHSLSIAAASIVAKVTRDRLMVEIDDLYPGYDFARHKGYGTIHHRRALVDLGPCPLHRRTFAPVRRRIKGELFYEISAGS
ncbi:MAG: ribonuclease HII [Anaerolineae bacterium]|nr:ribonuclease HII [Anaerolineae bacterium]